MRGNFENCRSWRAFDAEPFLWSKHAEHRYDCTGGERQYREQKKPSEHRTADASQVKVAEVASESRGERENRACEACEG